MHTHGYKSDLYGIAAARRARVPVVATCHNWTGASLPLRLYSILDRAVLHKAQHIAAVSEQVRRKLVQFAIPEAKITVIPNGIAIEPFRTARPTLRDEFNLGARTVIGVVGRLSSEKGHRFLLHAAQQLTAGFPDVAFLFVGAGPEQAALESLTRELNLADRIFFAGFRDHMPDVYASIDILALPSLKEGSPLVLLEAMAAALPVVATNVGDVEKIVVSGQSGLLVEPRNPQALRDALARLLVDIGLRRRLAASGQRCVAEHFSAASMAQKYIDIYEDALRCALAPSERTEPAAV
jgi:glycosyltransferase involved in cell wall biosynthesis